MTPPAVSQTPPQAAAPPAPLPPAAPLLIHQRQDAGPGLPALRPAPAAAQPRWSLLRRIGFRFLIIYVLLYFLPMPVRDFISGFGTVGGKTLEPVTAKAMEYLSFYDKAWESVVIPVGKRLFDVDIKVVPTGSGDTAFAYTQVLCIFVFATAGALTWSLLDRRRLAYPRLHEWLRVYVRYVLALTMLGYGLAKVIQTQFPPPGPERLLQTFGSASPMGLLWTFMGASTAYTFFSGFMECLGGLLLIPRRTVTLGAMVVVGTMLNVVLLNFCYDVPVKQYSVHLTLMALWLTLPDLPALMAVLLRTRPVPPAPVQPLFQRAWLRYSALALGLALIGTNVYGNMTQNYEFWKQMNDRTGLSPLAGIYEVESFDCQPGTATAPANDKSRWRRVIIHDYKTRLVLAVQQLDDQMPRYMITDDPEKKAITVALRTDPTKSGTLAYSNPEPGVLTLEGSFLGDTITARLRKNDKPDSLLMTRGFNWVQEFPFNR